MVDISWFLDEISLLAVLCVSKPLNLLYFRVFVTHLLAAGGRLAENRQMSDELKTTVRIQRPARIQADGRDRSVCAEPVEIAEFELLSTVALKKILKSNDESAKKSIAAAANCGDQGVLARDMATGHFEILDDADLQRIIEQDHKPPHQDKVADISYEPAFDSENSIDELSLVKTVALKKILKNEDVGVPIAEEIDISGFNPYDNS